MATDNLPEGWTKCLSKKYQKHFYYHAVSKRSVWVHPSLLKDNKDKVCRTIYLLLVPCFMFIITTHLKSTKSKNQNLRSFWSFHCWELSQLTLQIELNASWSGIYFPKFIMYDHRYCFYYTSLFLWSFVYLICLNCFDLWLSNISISNVRASSVTCRFNTENLAEEAAKDKWNNDKRS